MGLSGFLIILGVTSGLYMVSSNEMALLVIPLMLCITFGIYMLFYYLIQFLLFPYGQTLIKKQYHQAMNEKMSIEMRNTLIKVQGIIIEGIMRDTHDTREPGTIMKEKSH
jgi:uncharacterized membrane protein YccF (DUF307 family)